MNEVSLRDYCEEARSLIQSGEAGRAIDIIRHILRQYPRHLESYRLLGEALLVAGNYDDAATQFRRALSADPEDTTSRVGLSKVFEARGDLDKALWQMQRAVELLPADADLKAELARLITMRHEDDVVEPFETTRPGLGRIYIQQGLYAKAIQELKAVLTQEPERTDVRATLAQVLWRTGQRVEAVEVCHAILEKLPNALKANLIIGAMWVDSGQHDAARPHLDLAQALDPENQVAHLLFGNESPLLPRDIVIERLEEREIQSFEPQPLSTTPVESMPASERQEPVMDGMSKMNQEEAAPMSYEERPDEEFEVPDWLKGVGDELLESEEQPASSSPSQPEAEKGEGTPGWLQRLLSRSEEVGAAEPTYSAEPGDEADWLQELRPEDSEELGEQIVSPEAAGEFTAEEELTPQPTEDMPAPEAQAEKAELPDWLREVQEVEPVSEVEAEDTAASAPAEAEHPSFLEPVSEAGAGADLPDWLRDIMEGEATPAEEEEEEEAPARLEAEQFPEAEVDQAELPDWLGEYEVPSEVEGTTLEAEEMPGEGVPEPVATADEGRALWEQILAEEGVDIDSAEEALPPEAAGMTAQEWLRSTSDLGRAPSQPAAPEPSAEEPLPEEPGEEEIPQAADIALEGTPDWTLETGETFVPEAEAAEAELPDWLRDVAAGEPVSAAEGESPVISETSDLPAWLRELQEQEPTEEAAVTPEPVAPEVPDEIEEPVQPEVDKAGLPDWLREPSTARSELEEEEEKEGAPSAEMPEWLAELETNDMLLREADLGEPIELETGDMPEWLSEIMAGEPPLSEGWPAEVEAEEGQAPDWLREARQREEEAEAQPPVEAEEAEAPLEAQEEELAPAELPDWLIRLREGVGEEEEAPEPFEYPEVEAEAGLVEEPGFAEVEEAPYAEMPTELEAVEATEEGPDWLGDLVRAEEEAVEFEVAEEAEVTAAELAAFEFEAAEEEEEEWVPAETVAEAEELPVADIELMEEPEAIAEEEVIEEPEEAPVPELAAVPAGVSFDTRELEEIRAEDLPKDPEARLSMARAALNAGDWSEALTIYETLVSSSELLGSVIDNLQVGLRRHPDDATGYQLLGDAYMKEGRLPEALDAYRTALTKL
jgi:tetratricopeptide (TPR) repeat protein